MGLGQLLRFFTGSLSFHGDGPRRAAVIALAEDIRLGRHTPQLIAWSSAFAAIQADKSTRNKLQEDWRNDPAHVTRFRCVTVGARPKRRSLKHVEWRSKHSILWMIKKFRNRRLETMVGHKA